MPIENEDESERVTVEARVRREEPNQDRLAPIVFNCVIGVDDTC